MSRTLTSPSRQVSSITWRSSLPRAKHAISRGRRNPRSKKREVFMGRHCPPAALRLSTSRDRPVVIHFTVELHHYLFVEGKRTQDQTVRYKNFDLLLAERSPK